METDTRLCRYYRRHAPNDTAAVAVLTEELSDAQRAASLIRIRRLVMKERGVTLSEEEKRTVQEEEEAQMLAAVVGLGGEGRAWPRDAFTVLIDFLLPEWPRLRRGLGPQ